MISTRQVIKSYGSLQVLKGIDIEVAPSEIVSIVGPS
ncbi:MAG: lipoprotein-releasing system ATP-binding protein LolD, partial [Bacteroidales bacterium]